MNTQLWRVTHKYIKRFDAATESSEYFYKGDEFVPSDQEVKLFRDRLEPVIVREVIREVEAKLAAETSPAATKFDPSESSIKQVIDAVKSSEISADDAYTSEKSGLNRSTLLKQLENYL